MDTVEKLKSSKTKLQVRHLFSILSMNDGALFGFSQNLHLANLISPLKDQPP